jgi:hypothetical protein
MDLNQAEELLNAAWLSFIERQSADVVARLKDEPAIMDLIANAYKNGFVEGVQNADATLFDLWQKYVHKGN